MTDAFEEVEEDIRRERLMTFLKRWGPWILAALAAVILAIVGWRWYEQSRRDAAARVAAQVEAAREQAEAGEFDAAAAALAEAADTAQGDQRALALMQRAEVLMQTQDMAGALQSMEAAAVAAREPLIKDAATLKAAYLAAETEAVQALDARLRPLIDGRGPYSAMARELIAVEALEAGDVARARAEFEFLRFALEAPDSVRQRAEAGLAMIGPAPTAEAEPAPETPAAGDQQP